MHVSVDAPEWCLCLCIIMMAYWRWWIRPTGRYMYPLHGVFWERLAYGRDTILRLAGAFFLTQGLFACWVLRVRSRTWMSIFITDI